MAQEQYTTETSNLLAPVKWRTPFESDQNRKNQGLTHLLEVEQVTEYKGMTFQYFLYVDQQAMHQCSTIEKGAQSYMLKTFKSQNDALVDSFEPMIYPLNDKAQFWNPRTSTSKVTFEAYTGQKFSICLLSRNDRRVISNTVIMVT